MIKTINFHKTECGVDFLLNVGSGDELNARFTETEVYAADFFQVLLFKKVTGYLVLNEKRLDITDNTLVFISPYQKWQWHLEDDLLDFNFLIFQEDFLNEFFADKLFTYRLLYFYQLEHPPVHGTDKETMSEISRILSEIKSELKMPIKDSNHIIRSLLYYLLIQFNRCYIKQYHLSDQQLSNHAYEFKRLLEIHFKEKQRVNEYAALMGISRITLNKSVQAQFHVPATYLLKQRLLFEIKAWLIHTTSTIAEIAYQLHFSEPNHLMRFFKAQTGLTTSQFTTAYQNGTLNTTTGS